MNKLIFGRRRQGKSTLAMDLALKRNRSIAVYDINAQFEAWPESVVTSPDDLHAVLEMGAFKLIIYRPDTDPYAEFDLFAEELWERDDFVLLIDEAWELQTPQHCHPWLERFFRRASPDSIDVIETMHAPADCWVRSRTIAHELYFFRLTSANDLEAVAKLSDPRVAEMVKQLEPHQYICYDVDEGEAQSETDFSSWFVDLKGEKHVPALR